MAIYISKTLIIISNIIEFDDATTHCKNVKAFERMLNDLGKMHLLTHHIVNNFLFHEFQIPTE